MKYNFQIAWPARSVEERQKQCNGEIQGYSYSRDSDPTRDQLVASLGAMQQAKGGFAVSSGIAGLNLVINALVPCQQQNNFRPLVICGSGIHYECAERIRELGNRHGFDCMSLNTYDSSVLRQEMEQINEPSRIKLMWIEAIENPRLAVSNISKTCNTLKSIAPQARLIVDNTALPCFQHSLRWGADVEVISLAKYPGQGTVNGGLVLTRNLEIEKILYDENSYLGAILGSQDAMEIINRLSGICHRVEQHCRNADRIARCLKEHPAVETVFYPTIPGSCLGADEDTVKRQMSGMGGGIVSFELVAGLSAGKRLMRLVAELQETIFIQPTFGMPTTHLEHFATFHSLSEVITPGLCRLSVGLKRPEKIWNTLKRLLDQL